MKKFFCSVIIAACAALAFCSCETLDPDKDFSGTIYGFWVVDKLEVTTETTTNGTTNSHTSTTDFSNVYGRLLLDTSNLAQVWCNLLHTDIESFTYDESKGQIVFKEALDAHDDGKAIIFLGKYDVILDGDRMTLRQPEATLKVGDLFGAKERSTYTLHRAAEKYPGLK